ncbi:MAG TPA: hypothetical protein VEQ63_02780 [Bryobacteraceae bacterium]|nr:hypothetical protein [Bryobacteraceae bacterium]
MNRRALGVLAIIIIVLMAIVATAGLDNLPRELRARAQSVAAAIGSDPVGKDAGAVENAIVSDPDLFRTQAASLRARISKARELQNRAVSTAPALKRLADANRREDREKLEQELARVERFRRDALAESGQARQQAERWLGYKRNLPGQLSAMQSSYQAIQSWDAAAATSAAQKAMVDWPVKAQDLKSRIDALNTIKEQGQNAWQSSADARAKAEAKDWANLDYAGLFSAGERLQGVAKQLEQATATVNALAGQLYVDRNKVLLDLDEDAKRQRVRVVETKFADATLKDGAPQQQERWEGIDEARTRQLADNVGMVVERKPAGKYDNEAERTPEPPTYAYVAPPGQANQYGSWSNGVWTWLPQYLILSQLLRGGGGYNPPIRYEDYRGYERARSRGETWYGHSGEYRRSPATGSSARRALERARSGRSDDDSPAMARERSSGYSGSRYQNRGSYSGSRYQSRGGGFGSFGSRSYSRGGGGFGGFRRGGRR